MDGIIINELSLSGQFHDSQDFWKNGMAVHSTSIPSR